jgi:hypothetical protein
MTLTFVVLLQSATGVEVSSPPKMDQVVDSAVISLSLALATQ